ncbi:MAG: cupredoxin domain-containing protein [Actinobacteria bacterium]|nr:cupredoxin domain-containing protein [Actinomycetota bacterium]
MRRMPMIVMAVVMLTAACSNDKSGSSGSAATDAKSSSLADRAGLSGKVNDKGTKTVTGSSPTISVEVDDFYFSPTFISAPAGSTVTLQIKSEGKAPHTFTADGAGVDEKLSPGDSKTVTITVPKSGAVAFFCKFHKSSGMQGAVVVPGPKGSGASSGGSGGSGGATTSGGSGY